MGREAWPGIEVDDEAFARWVAARTPPGGEAAALCLDDLYLAHACAQGDPRALARFDERFLAALPAVLHRHPPAVVDEVRQLLRERLFVAPRPRIADYSGRGSLAAWVRVVALRLAANLRRGERDHEPLPDDDVPAALPALDPELALIRARCGEVFGAAFRDAFATLSVRERTALRLHFLDGLSLERVGAALGVSRATGARWILAGRERLGAELVRLLGERLRCERAELESLLGVVRSKLDLSLGALLREPA